MDDDKDSFIVFIESESFDKTQKLKHDFYPESSEGYSFLELCCYHGAVDCFKLLRTKFNSEITPQCLQFSFLSGKPDILNECLKFQEPDQECMRYAIISFNVDFITFLNREYELEIDLDTCRLWKNYQAFFIYLDVSNDIENCFPYTPCFGTSIFEYFISQGVDINAKENQFHATALHFAALIGNIEIVKFLISRGLNINSTDISGASILNYAAFYSDKKTIEFLIENGADINAKNKNGITILQVAASTNNYGAAKILILHSKKIISKSNFEETIAFIDERDNDG
ncbi:ankyrin repeat protein, putative [Trichomonas vaginalis G3]|uniref:Ankyrin repeat protein, putative n=1 Tax=Trichomonas vaginalis (strain ATCC PRA-98 / G3) TaxID=412133 RepID=A2EQA7_TRIV3|nr:proteasome regulatory particle assembly [Trichomonas vaginalis G3]EAY05190.1 ankyrin repeat protein, putative [Trichomonas vaginalis G3]KAI5522960.1 proteasome regulatory particle assembly [Trichomonas vaginalis G3]|eukprot:XP_001317413.1 ankyrin repeat protein [Trichomonas vaginalis G3]